MHRGRVVRTGAMVAAIALGLPTLASEPCSEELVMVSAPGAETVALVCEAADFAVPFVAACGLPLLQRVPVHAIADFQNSNPNNLAVFDGDAGEITIPHFGDMDRTLEARSPYRALPRDRYFRSVIVHELAHAALDQHNPSAGTADHEYVAYVTQFAALRADRRQVLLDLHAVAVPVKREDLNAMVAAMLPTLFAARAWAHFRAPENGCAFFAALADGRTTLGRDMP